MVMDLVTTQMDMKETHVQTKEDSPSSTGQDVEIQTALVGQILPKTG